jgi:hypothetical protein
MPLKAFSGFVSTVSQPNSLCFIKFYPAFNFDNILTTKIENTPLRMKESVFINLVLFTDHPDDLVHIPGKVLASGISTFVQ